MSMEDPRARAIKTPRMIPVSKNLGSWRESGSPAPALPPPAGGPTIGADDLHLVKIARCPSKAVITAAIAQAQVELARSVSPNSSLVSPPPQGGGMSIDPEIFHLPPPKALPGRRAGSAPPAGHTVGISETPLHAPQHHDSPGAGHPDVMGDSATGLPAMSLPPSAPSEVLETAEVHVVPCRSQRLADALKKAVIEKSLAMAHIHANSKSPGPHGATTPQKSAADASHDDEAIVDVVTRPHPGTSTVVVKGLPLSIKHERLWEELSCMASPPSYIRFHRNDRGLFKNIVYVKFPSKLKAEIGRMELERMTVGGRPLRVELKKPKTATVEEARRAEAGRREDLKVISLAQLEHQVLDLAKDHDNEGMSYIATSLTGDEKKYLKGLCDAHDLIYDSSAGLVTVKKKHDRRVSPSLGARTPPFHPATPPVQSADMEFRGIRHWREQRMALGTPAIGVLHKNAGDTPSWGSGRGRPV